MHDDRRPLCDLRARVQGDHSTTDANALSKEVGGTGDMPAQDLEVTAPGEESGTYDAFLDLAGIEDSAIEDGVAEDAAAALRSTTRRRRTTT